ncbi:ATP-dependent helicase [Burkholderia phage BcepSaruman]|uniref:ATP-dependent helicase n=1 Tax=Burkholderia phage BcepSaruman TaxID=2530032 RepID=A0A4D5ZD13_9CAUD|nr:ATP-dependent helicase [Burkholderia phage BcepSaruman]QBX06721.1 ATP-dependent helicase [Burkholderia phage BcepSaruman]
MDVREELIEKYKFRFYEDKSCRQCEFFEDRHSDACDNCGAFLGGADLASVVKMGEKDFIKTPLGDAGGLKQVLEKSDIQFKFKKHFPDKTFSRPIKFTGTLKDYQPGAVEAILKRKRGVLKAPPRSGKTVMGAAAVCQLGKKTIIMASQREWIMGFQETFIGSDTQAALTDCRKDKIGLCKTYEDFLKYDICLVTCQTFWSDKGRKLLRKVRDMFAMLLVDEIHTGAAPKYASVIAALNCEYKIGLSGTPNRKDGRYVLMRNLMGPVIADIKVERLRPHVRLVKTAYSQNTKGQVQWTRLVSGIENNPQRLKLIAEWAVKDANNGHMILIPMALTKPIKALVAAINKIAGAEIAKPFLGSGSMKKTDRDRILQEARQYKIKVLVGTTKLLTTGTNIPRASALYLLTPSSNMENAEQRGARVLTPFEGKPTPIWRIFLDNVGVSRRCLANEWWGCMKPKFKPVMTDKDEKMLLDYLKQKGNGGSMEGRIEL